MDLNLWRIEKIDNEHVIKEIASMLLSNWHEHESDQNWEDYKQVRWILLHTHTQVNDFPF